MYLKTLKISGKIGIIREINFRNGINLVVDETISIDGKETGNNVGKTTVLMLIDFCLGADAKIIYIDPENKKEEYKLVKDFLVENEIIVTLVLKKNLSDIASPEICIERNFLPRKKKIQKIDGINKTEEEFKESLANILFPEHHTKKPSFREIISHNIRYKDLSLKNTIKILSQYTTDAEYETLYLFLLGCGFEHGEIKQELLTNIKQESAFKKRLEKNQTKSTYETAISILEDEIVELNYRKSSFNLNKNFESDLEALNQVKYKINSLSSEIGKLKIRRNIILDAVKDLESSTSKIDLQQLEFIYKQTNLQIGGIQKTFEDMVNFHNLMLKEKVRYIASDIPSLDKEIDVKSQHLRRLLEEEGQLASVISRTESFEALEQLITELNVKYQKKGEYENIIQQLSEVESNLDELNQHLNHIDEELFSSEYEHKVQIQINKFNKYFSSISQVLYGEQYALKKDLTTNKNGQKLYKFSAFNTNFSSGKKQGEIACFDIAYTLFADEENIPCLHFLLNDQRELLHDNQLLNIANLVNDKKIQFVASFLKDKLPDELNKEEYFVLKLTHQDKLFRIENVINPR